MKTRGKFRVYYVTSYSEQLEKVVLSAVHGGSTENNSFASATPSGSLEITITNPEVIGKFKPGAEYYLDLIPVEA